MSRQPGKPPVADAGHAGRWLVVAASVVVVATVVAAVVVMGSPSAQRDTRLDARRAADLSRLASAVERWFERHDALPPGLAELAAEPGVRLAIADPVTGTPYDYAPTGARSYRLCATFTTDTAQVGNPADWPGEAWSHDAGPQCFERKVVEPGTKD